MTYAAYVGNVALTKFILIGFGSDEPEAETKLERRLNNMPSGTKGKVVAYKEKQDAPELLPYAEPKAKRKVKAAAKPKRKTKAKAKPKATVKPTTKKRRKSKKNPKGFEAWKHLWIQVKPRSFIVWNEKQTRKLGTFKTQRGARRFIGNKTK